MLLLCSVFLMSALGVFLAARRMKLQLRLAVAVALATFIVPSVATIFWLARVGDPAPPGSTTIEALPR